MGWTFHTKLYNFLSYGDCFAAHRVRIIINRLLDAECNADVTTVDTLNTGNPCGYEEYIDDSLYVTDDFYSLPLPVNVLSSFIQTTEPSRILPFVIAATAPCVNTLVTSVFLHPSYPCM